MCKLMGHNERDAKNKFHSIKHYKNKLERPHTHILTAHLKALEQKVRHQRFSQQTGQKKHVVKEEKETNQSYSKT